jgi:hypothetical protein
MPCSWHMATEDKQAQYKNKSVNLLETAQEWSESAARHLQEMLIERPCMFITVRI